MSAEIKNPDNANYNSVLTAKMGDDDLREVHTIMVHFDTLFDIRAAALSLISEEYFSMIRIDGSYYKRGYDVFGDQELGVISKNKLDQVIQDCSDAVAQRAQMSRAIEMLMDYVTEYIDKNKMSPHAQHLSLLLNFGHYPFSDEQKLAVFDEYYKIFDPIGVQVNACDYTIGQLGQAALMNVDSLFIYDWMNWLKCHEKSIENYKINTRIHAPKVVPIPSGDTSQLEQVKKTLKELRMTPFDFIRKGISRYLNFIFLDICYYCVLDEFNNFISERGGVQEKK